MTDTVNGIYDLKHLSSCLSQNSSIKTSTNGESMSNIQISLVIPTFDRADLITFTIESALNQTKRFLDIIVVDDGSTDNTENILIKFHTNIKYIRTKNIGVQNARNVGAAAASGTYITFCDSDDLLEENFVEIIENFLNGRSNCNAVYTNFTTFRGEETFGTKFSSAPKNFFNGQMYDKNFIISMPDLYIKTIQFQPFFVTGLTIEKSAFFNIGGFNTLMHKVPSEDWEFTLRVLAKCSVGICLMPLARIRKHGSNESRDPNRQTSGEARILEFALKNHDEARKWENVLIESINNRRVDAFNGYFSRKMYIEAYKVASLINIRPKNVKFYVKYIISKALSK